ncbi:OB-fold domain-containing protein [Cryptosporangium minutisporangium]|uniref:OB-fold nucleic acid binding domain-containing protein n=1 Tax=Cryptosporangium minutisporangium TaxID=113569 RepID=A0ABP6ST38_9ACTN
MTTFVESTVRFPYKRSLGPVIGQFMTALTERRLLGIRAGDRVIAPPLEWDPETGEQLDPELIEVGPAGTVRSWTWVAEPSPQHPLDRPFAFALIELDGATTAMVHAVDVAEPGAMTTGMRVAPRWRAARVGHLTDIEAFVPGEEPVVPADDAGPAAEPVTMMGYEASIVYTTPLPGNQERAGKAAARGVLLGFRCPRCGRIYSGLSGSCPVDGLLLSPEDDVELPQVGVITNYTIITPVQYPGQTETEPFARVQVLLDGVDVVLAYQPVADLPNVDIHTGVRVAARWSEADGRKVLDGWAPTGEPDIDDPSLVNRIM